MTQPLPETASDTSPERPWPVRHLSPKIKDYVDKMSPVWVEGQAVNVKRWRQLVFLTLRDAEAEMSLSAVVPASEVDALDQPLADGAQVVLHAKPEWRLKNGSFQLNARELRAVGIGDLLARIEKLREALAKEGLFADDRKVPLPFVPKLVGLVCANQGDAEHDVLVNATERWPSVKFEIRRVTVQGANCVPETSAAIRELDAHPDVDVIVVARGGGSLEDLLPFSAEALLRVAANCVTPLVSAIGHEKDNPLFDLVADLRASTPTDAGKRIVPDAAQEARGVAGALASIRASIESRLDREAEALIAYLTRPVMVHPNMLIDPHKQELARVAQSSGRALVAILSGAQGGLTELKASLRALSPQSTLDRGYAVVHSPAGEVVRNAGTLTPGDPLTIRFAAGEAAAAVTEARPAT